MESRGGKTATTNPAKGLEVFFSYAHKDEKWRKELEKHLSLLKSQGLITQWNDREIGAGKEWKREIDAHLKTAHIILLLISPDFMASDFCYDIEMKIAMKRHNAGEARVVPIILHEVDWKKAPFGKLQALPTDGRAVTSWSNRNQALLNVATGIRKIVEELLLVDRVPESSTSTIREAMVDKQEKHEQSNLIAYRSSNFAQANNKSIAIVNVYEQVAPHPIERSKIDAALRQLAQLPLNTLPEVRSLPPGSHIPFARNPLFVGRKDELYQLAALLKERPLATVAVSGLGGLGKSQLASEFVHRYGQYFTGGIFWINCEDGNAIPTEIAACHTALEQELGLDVANLSLEKQLSLVLSAWQNDIPRLLVFDNCEEETMLAQWRPTTGGCRVLITTRKAIWDPELGVDVLALKTLHREESLVLLSQHRSDLSKDQLNSIAEDLGDLPLALYLVGCYLYRYRDSKLGNPTTYLAHLHQVSPLQHQSLQGDNATYSTGHVRSVEQTFAMSYKRLDASNSIDAYALLLLGCIAHLVPGMPIPRDLLRRMLELTQTGILDDLFHGAQKGLNTEVLVVNTIERLIDLGLLETQRDSTLRLNRLLAEFVQMYMGPAYLEAGQIVELVLWENFIELNFERSLAQARVLQPHLRKVTDKALLREDDIVAADLSEQLGVYLTQIGDYAEAERYLLRSLTIREKLFGPKFFSLSLTLVSLANLYSDQGRYTEAELIYQRALAIRKEAADMDSPSEAEFNLANLYAQSGRHAEAEHIYLQQLQRDEQKLGLEHPDLAITLNSLGSLYHYQGKYEVAESHYRRALSILEASQRMQHHLTAIVLSNLGNLYRDEEKYAAAEQFYRQALQINIQVLGPEHLEVAKTLGNLAYTCDKQKKYEEIESLYKQALQIYEQTRGSEHSDTARILYNLAAFYCEQKKYAEAEPLHQEALRITEKILGSGAPEVAQSLNDLAATYHAQEKYEAAEPLYQRALQIYEQTKGSEHKIAHILYNLASLYMDQGNFITAEPLYLRALTIQEEVLGPEDEEVAQTLNELARLYGIQGRYETAKLLSQRAVLIYQQSLGENDALTQEAVYLAEVLKWREAGANARKFLQKLKPNTLWRKHKPFSR